VKRSTFLLISSNGHSNSFNSNLQQIPASSNLFCLNLSLYL
jgi:hypothetical protein